MHAYFLGGSQRIKDLSSIFTPYYVTDEVKKKKNNEPEDKNLLIKKFKILIFKFPIN
jgi:hypothetical protein